MPNFNEMNLSDAIVRAISSMGFEEPTPIQEQAIPMAMAGRDIIGQAQTGTGKTAAFGIPMLEKINRSDKIQGLVVTPTRELAIQVAEELNKISQYKYIRALPIYGGQDIQRQIKALYKRPQIIVGTPGRLLDHIRRETINLDQIVMVVLDEADEMLNMGFIEDIEAILSKTPSGRQTMLFSATMPKPIQDLARQFMKNPEMVAVRSKEMTVPTIEQKYIELKEREKFDVLCRLLDIHSPEAAIVFGRTKRRVDELSEGLAKRGYSAEGIHGDLTQAKRDSVMRQFRDGAVEVLVATDVAARGLDITGVTHVYNFDIPQDPESYVHRIGRTGRAGKAGLAVTLVTSREIEHLRIIERLTKRRIAREGIPSLSEAIEGQQKLAMENLLKTLDEGAIDAYRQGAESLLEQHDSVALLAAALKLLTKEPDLTPVQLTDEAPLRVKRPKHNSYDDFRNSGRRGNMSGRYNNRSGKHDNPGSRGSYGRMSGV